MADMSVGLVVNKLAELATNEATFLIKINKDMRVLRDKLEWLQAFLNDADRKCRGSSNAYIEVWVRQTRDLAFDLEDILDEFFRKAEKLRSSRSSGLKAALKFKWMMNNFIHMWVAHKLSSKIDVVKERLLEVHTNKDDYKINFVPFSSSSGPTFRRTFSAWDHTFQEEAVGMDNKIIDLTKLLLEGSMKREVISIIGEPSAGKSLLAKKVYGSREIKLNFEIVVWKSLAAKFRASDLFYDIYCEVLSQLKQDPGEEGCEQEDFGKLLYALLRERQYLVVLDGLVSLTDWKHIITLLPNKDKGSRVLLIPRFDSVVARLDSPEVTRFKQDIIFTEKETMQLFDSRFAKNIHRHEFGPDIREIHNVTEGHPLTIVLLAGLLRTKDSLSEWDRVFNHLKAKKGTKPIDSMLSLSFDDLPHQLKSCFLYFAVVPESPSFMADQLVRLWITEGFIQPKPGKTLEEIGEDCLRELISRSLIRVQQKNEYGGIAMVAVDDLIHAFVKSEAHESSFVEIHDNADIVSSRTIRRLFIQNHTHKHVRLVNPFPKMRSLMCDCVEENSNNYRPHKMMFLLKSKFLRVIDLRGLMIKRLPHAFGDIIHLRYMSIRCYSLKQLPSSISKLLHLQTLDIRRTHVNSLPKSFWKISELRHIFADRIKLPKSIGKLNNLQTLQIADCTDWKENVGLLENMTNVRSLGLKELSGNQANIISNSLHNLEFLRHLFLGSKNNHTLPSSIFTISTLRCLHSLELRGQIDNPEGPDFEADDVKYNFPNLISLTLKLSKVRQGFIYMLSKLPSLANLYLNKAYDGKKLVFKAGGFPNITNLCLANLSGLEECNFTTPMKEKNGELVPFKKAAMPNLTELTIRGCSALKELPNGLQEKGKLEEVTIYEMRNIVKEIQAGVGKNFQKIKHVPFVKTRI